MRDRNRHREEDLWSRIPKDDKWRRQLKELGLSDVTNTGRLLGRGATGDVFEVKIKRENSEVEQVMACKILRPRKSWDKSYEDIMHDCRCILADVKVMTEIRHPFIVGIYGALRVTDLQTNFPFSMILLLMEKCDGDLFRVLKMKILTEPLQKVWFRQIGEALDFLHNQMKTAHLDIKPDNILVKFAKIETNEWPQILRLSRYKLTDFGYAANLGAKVDNVKNVIGTMMYQAPEIRTENLDGPRHLDKCDIFSFGMSLRAAVVASKPQDMNYESYEKDFSQEMKDLINRMLKSTPEERPDIRTVLSNRWLLEPQQEPQLQTEPEPKIKLEPQPEPLQKTQTETERKEETERETNTETYTKTKSEEEQRQE